MPSEKEVASAGYTASNERMPTEQITAYLIQSIRSGIPDGDAGQLVRMGAELNAVDKLTGQTAFHMAAAMGRRDLFEMFSIVARPDFSLKDFKGRTMADLAAIVAQDYVLCARIHAMEAEQFHGPALD